MGFRKTGKGSSLGVTPTPPPAPPVPSEQEKQGEKKGDR